MKANNKKLEPFKEVLVECAGLFGRPYAAQMAQELAGARDYLCFSNWLTGVTGDENFGSNPKANPIVVPANQDALDYLFERFENRVLAYKALLEEKDRTIRLLRWQVESMCKSTSMQLQRGVARVLRVCEAKA